MSRSLLQITEEFPRRKILVVGDAILDHYILGAVERMSPEAPVPVLNVLRDEWLPGGAANVARNLAAQGARVVFVSVCGTDAEGERLIGLLGQDKKIRLNFERDAARPTTLKTRCIAQGQQMLRLDRENPGPPSAKAEANLLRTIQKALPNVDGVVLSDYRKGLLTGTLTARVIEAAAGRGIEVIVDPKGTDYSLYRGAALITPNRKEAQEASGVRIHDEESSAAAARVLQRRVGGKAICITLGAGGVAVFPRRGRPVHVPARAREVYDVTGAGDTFLALMALARFSGATFAEGAEIASIAAGIVVGRTGVATVTANELRSELSGAARRRRAIGLEELVEIRRSMARAGRKVVFTNGCFDVLNVLHIRLLEQARALGDLLVVALNSDRTVRLLKGEPRPLLSETERIEMLSALPTVDYVTVFDDDTPCELLRRLQPDILVKGDNMRDVVGRDIVEGYGGEVRLLDLGFGPTTEEIIHRATEPVRKKARRVKT